MSERFPIFLVGFMGAGKSTVGRHLARRISRQFIDLDDVISARAGKTVRAIFDEQGEREFRRMESEAIESCRELGAVVISLGGGAYESAENRDAIRKIGKTVWLDCPLGICMARIAGDKSRPKLSSPQEMRDLLEARRASYASADYRVETGRKRPERIAGEIQSLLEREGVI